MAIEILIVLAYNEENEIDDCVFWG